MFDQLFVEENQELVLHRIHKALKELGVTPKAMIKDVAKKTGYSFTAVYNYLNRVKPLTFKFVTNLSLTFAINPMYIRYGERDPEGNNVSILLSFLHKKYKKNTLASEITAFLIDFISIPLESLNKPDSLRLLSNIMSTEHITLTFSSGDTITLQKDKPEEKKEKSK